MPHVASSASGVESQVVTAPRNMFLFSLSTKYSGPIAPIEPWISINQLKHSSYARLPPLIEFDSAFPRGWVSKHNPTRRLEKGWTKGRGIISGRKMLPVSMDHHGPWTTPVTHIDAGRPLPLGLEASERRYKWGTWQRNLLVLPLFQGKWHGAIGLEWSKSENGIRILTSISNKTYYNSWIFMNIILFRMVLCTAEFAHLLPMNVQHIVDGALDVLHGGSCLEGSSFIYVISCHILCLYFFKPSPAWLHFQTAPERVSGHIFRESETGAC